MITHNNKGEKDYYITTGIKLGKDKEFKSVNSSYVKVSQSLYKISEDFEASEDSDESK